jgi:hypothetical protein
MGLFSATTRAAEQPQPAPRLAKMTPAEKKAVQLAQAFLAKKKVKWGKPVKVTREAKEKRVFLIVYPTPAREKTLLGDRAVRMNIATKKVAFVPRE